MYYQFKHVSSRLLQRGRTWLHRTIASSSRLRWASTTMWMSYLWVSLHKSGSNWRTRSVRGTYSERGVVPARRTETSPPWVDQGVTNLTEAPGRQPVSRWRVSLVKSGHEIPNQSRVKTYTCSKSVILQKRMDGFLYCLYNKK